MAWPAAAVVTDRPTGGSIAGGLCSGEKFFPKGRAVTARGRSLERGLPGGPCRGGLRAAL